MRRFLALVGLLLVAGCSSESASSSAVDSGAGDAGMRVSIQDVCSTGLDSQSAIMAVVQDAITGGGADGHRLGTPIAALESSADAVEDQELAEAALAMTGQARQMRDALLAGGGIDDIVFHYAREADEFVALCNSKNDPLSSE